MAEKAVDWWFDETAAWVGATPATRDKRVNKTVKCPVRLAAQDSGLSIRKQGFDSPTGYSIKACVIRNWHDVRETADRIVTNGAVRKPAERPSSNLGVCGFESRLRHMARSSNGTGYETLNLVIRVRFPYGLLLAAGWWNW